jgi:HSP20 family protein
MGDTATAVQRTKNKEPVAVRTTTPEAFIDQMRQAFDAISRRAFEIFDGNGRLGGHDIEDWLKAENELFHPVHVDIADSGETITVQAEVPGFNETELRVTVEPARLTISGKREFGKEENKDKTVHSDICSNELFRLVELPAEVDVGNVTATLRDGMLQLTMPKSKPQTVDIKAQLAA